MATDEQRAELAEVAAVFKTRALVNTAAGRWTRTHRPRFNTNLMAPVCDLSVRNCPIRAKSAI
jgi:hypothetical protein